MKISRRGVVAGGLATAAAPMFGGCSGVGSESLRLAVLKFGSLSWLMETIRAEGIDRKLGLDIETLEVGTNTAGPLALIAGSADVIVSDWPWAMRQRSEGELLKFAPYSSALGAVMVGPDSGIKTLADLKGKRLGVAGSPVDKSWILLRAYTREKLGEDIATLATPVYGAAPLIAEELKGGRIDAVLNFWTFSARLAGNGFVPVISMAEVLRELGVDPVPLVGFVWKEKSQALEPEKYKAFLEAIAQGNQVLAKSDKAWERLRGLMRAKSDSEFVALRDYYRSGIPTPWQGLQTESAEKLLDMLLKLGNKDLAGRNTKFDGALFHVGG